MFIFYVYILYIHRLAFLCKKHSLRKQACGSESGEVSKRITILDCGEVPQPGWELWGNDHRPPRWWADVFTYMFFLLEWKVGETCYICYMIVDASWWKMMIVHAIGFDDVQWCFMFHDSSHDMGNISCATCDSKWSQFLRAAWSLPDLAKPLPAGSVFGPESNLQRIVALLTSF